MWPSEAEENLPVKWAEKEKILSGATAGQRDGGRSSWKCLIHRVGAVLKIGFDKIALLGA